MPDIIGEVLWYMRVEGWPFLIRKGLRKCLSIFFEYRTCVVPRRYITDLSLDDKPGIDVVGKIATLDDLGKFSEIVGPMKLKLFEQRMRAERFCYIALDGDKIVAYLWNAFDLDPRLEPIPFNLSLRPHEVYVYDNFVLPKYRRERISAVTRPIRRRIFDEKGIRYRVGWHHVDNVGAFTRSMGRPALERELVRCLKILWFRKSWTIKLEKNVQKGPNL